MTHVHFFLIKIRICKMKFSAIQIFKLFINEIIAHIIITTENDFEQCELNFSKTIYIIIKKYK